MRSTRFAFASAVTSFALAGAIAACTPSAKTPDDDDELRDAAASAGSGGSGRDAAGGQGGRRDGGAGSGGGGASGGGVDAAERRDTTGPGADAAAGTGAIDARGADAAAGRDAAEAKDAGGGGGDAYMPSAAFKKIYDEILSDSPMFGSCGKDNECHVVVGGAAAGDLRFGDLLAAYMSLVGPNSKACPNRKLVVPGNPGQSVLSLIVKGPVTGCDALKDRMPKERAKLSDAQIKLIDDWIQAGAK